MSREERIKKDFESHIAIIDQFVRKDVNMPKVDIEVLTWKKPGSYNYYVKFMVVGNTLFVYGDLGEAIYQWSEGITFEWLSNLDLPYFAGKCQASEVGRDFKEWNERKALEALKHFEKQEYFKWSDLNEEDGKGSLYDKREWEEWLREHGHKVLGEDYWDWAYVIGNDINTRCVYHFMGLQMAMKQIKEGAKV